MASAILVLRCLGILWSVLPIFLFPQESQHEMKDFTKILLDCTKTKLTCRRAWMDDQVSRNLCRRGWKKILAKNAAKQHMLYALLSNFTLASVSNNTDLLRLDFENLLNTSQENKSAGVST